MFTVPQAAAYLGIGTWAMRGLHWNGALPGVFLGRRLMFDRQKIDAYVDGLLAEAAR
jgi:excisionase family DNA binding protein